jgi:type VI secretion system protein ImpL
VRKPLQLASAALLAYFVLVWFGGAMLALKGGPLWIFRASLWLIGIAAAAVVLWFVRQRRKPGAAGSCAEDDIALLVSEAQRKLVQAHKEGGIGGLPAVFLLGQKGSAKTSILVNSGIEAELLAGRVYDESAIAPTRSSNLWFGHGVVFVELGGQILADASLRTRLIRAVSPSRLRSAMGKGGEAARAALVCFDAETFIRPGGQEAAAATSRELRQRLGEIAGAFGVNLPVYVLFSRMDRIPFFQEFVRNLSNDEARLPLGATLPLGSGRQKGLYEDQEAARLTGAFEGLHQSLCDARLEILGREHDAAQLSAAYEFPREFRKLGRPVVAFLTDLCRPSQLSNGPFLRGFYFCGVRPVTVEDIEQAPAPVQRQPEFQGVSDATSIFRGAITGQAAPPTPPRRTRRGVPQWLFVGYFFNKVLLADRVALGASSASVKTSLLRRICLGLATVLCLALATAFTISYARNRALESRVREAVSGISSAERTAMDVPSTDSLRRLDKLRECLQLLGAYRREGPPLSYRWGLYAGDGAYLEARRLYFRRFHEMLLVQTQTALLGFLRQLPPTPGPEYGPTYEALKAHLITTSNHDKSTREFLPPALLRYWSANRNIDPEGLQLAQKQFEFYSDELRWENPFSSESDLPAVQAGRRYLSQFAGLERIYLAMIADAGKASQPVQFNRRFPGSAAVIVDSYEVPGAFTRGGWDLMRKAIAEPDRYFSGEQWVLGEQTTTNIDRVQLKQQLQQRYFADFATQWRAYLRNATVVQYASVADAARKLILQSGNQSPLLALFWLASQNTAVDAPEVTALFQPIHAVVPPGIADRFVAPSNQNYVNALMTLQASLESVAGQAQPPDEAAASGAVNNAGAAKLAARQVAQAFRIDPEAHVETMVQKLMEDPITQAETLLRNMGSGELNGKGEAFCAQLRPLMGKYPFNPNAGAQATMPEVDAIFRPKEGALWKLYDESLSKLLVRQGNQYTAAPDAKIRLNGTFVAFFNRIAGFAQALYGGATSAEPALKYTLKPTRTEGVQRQTLNIGGQTLSYSGGNPAPKQFIWNGRPQEVKAAVRLGTDLTWQSKQGLWAAFQFFGEAEKGAAATQVSTLQWVIRVGKDPLKLPNGNPLTVAYELDMGAAPPVFQKTYFSQLACVSRITQ